MQSQIEDELPFDDELDGYDEGPAGPYRAMSGLAAASLAFGFLSVLTCLHWGVGFIPLIGILLGILALRRIGRAPEERTGFGVAWAGIGVSVLLWIAGCSVQLHLYYSQAPPGYFPLPYALLQADPNNPGQLVPPTAHNLEDQRVFIKGYMTPGRQYRRIKNFILCRDNGVCAYCNPKPKPHDLIEVKLLGLEAEYTTHLIGVGGKFKVHPDAGKPGFRGILYQLEADVLR
jgi:hypothetical protein